MTEKEIILTSIMNCRCVDLYTERKPLTPTQENRLEEILKRRKSGEPLQYILGNCEFMGLKFLVDKRVLIPRPETELLIEAVMEQAQISGSRPLSILDIGTGSGNIAVSLAKNIPRASLVSVDISNEAITLAKANARLNGVLKKIKFIKSDLFQYWRNNVRRPKLFDIIVSNPPYIASHTISTLASDVQAEPRLAFDGGPDGLYFFRRIIDEAPEFLKPGGFLFFEIGDGQKEALEKIINEKQEFILTQFIKDYVRTERIVIAERR